MKVSVLSVGTVVVLAMFFWCHPVSGSYLGYPRLNFAGQFRADSCTSNNNRCYYLPEDETKNNFNNNWGVNGTNEFQFFDNHITSVVYEDGVESISDELVGHDIIGNLLRPFAKMTDLDVDCQDKSTIYGMNFGVEGLNSDSPALYGKWTPSVIAQDMWPILKCYSDSNFGSELFQDSFYLGSQGTTFVTNVEWDNSANSVALQQLQDAVGITGKLSVRLSILYYTRNYPPFIALNATLGYVTGTIGVASQIDTLNFGGQRILNPIGNIPDGMSFSENDLCYDQDLADFQPWMSKAPFEIDTKLDLIHVDFSNALTVSLYNTMYDVGTLRLGILTDIQSTECVKLLGDDVPYLSAGFLSVSGGIYTVPVTNDDIVLLSNSKLVVAQIISWSDGNTYTPICGEFLLPQADQHVANILLEETPYFVRPWNYYVDRLEYKGVPSSQTLYVTYFGQPASGVQIKLFQSESVPQTGVQPDSWIKSTDESGMVTFDFSVTTPIPYPRQYSEPQCSPFNVTTLPIDGEIYQFVYCVDTDPSCTSYQNVQASAITFLAFSTVSYTRPYDWLTDVKPIFASYAMTAPIMKTILDLGSYEDVTLPHNIHLLTLSLLIEFENPGFMPTTRDLSPTKRAMIFGWLTDPIYDKTEVGGEPQEVPVCITPTGISSKSNSASFFDPPRCLNKLCYLEKPGERDAYFGGLFAPLKSVRFAIGKTTLPQRPLLGLKKLRDAIRTRKGINFVPKGYEPLEQCTVATLKQQLQTAVQLEFATIPTYSTSLYSIVKDCNVDIYQRIRSVIIQEMLHMTQAANILIAIGGTPIIDDASTVPSYPTYLPGNVLPGLLVSLKKLSLVHVYEVFMGIEIPNETEVGGPIDNPDLYTIGAFYDEIVDCLDFLDEQGTDIFDPDTVPDQVQWPWDATSEVGTVYTIVDHDSAVEAIREVVTQGEGAGLLNPYDIANNSLAHFFKFEEVVCQNEIVDNDGFYSYSGEPIPFNPNGVWPMRDNPTAEGILPNTNCYTEARVFHGAYRRLLRVLQETFSGNPKKISVAVEVMEALQVHAKKLMWTKYRPNSEVDDSTCGPVWDYNWPEDM